MRKFLFGLLAPALLAAPALARPKWTIVIHGGAGAADGQPMVVSIYKDEQ